MERLTEKEVHHSLVPLSLPGVSGHPRGDVKHTGKCGIAVKETSGCSLSILGFFLASPFLLTSWGMAIEA